MQLLIRSCAGSGRKKCKSYPSSSGILLKTKSAVSCTYFILAPECLGSLLNSKTADGTVIYNTAVAYPIGIVFAALLLALFIRATKKRSAKKSA